MIIVYFHFQVETSQWTGEKINIMFLLCWFEEMPSNAMEIIYSFSVWDWICFKRLFGYGKALMKQIWLNSDSCKWILPIEQSKLVHEPCGQQGESLFYIYWIIIFPEAWKSKRKVGYNKIVFSFIALLNPIL